MARTSFANVQALPDAAQAWNFDLFFPTIPGSSRPGINLTYRCKTTELPSSSIEAVSIELHGVKKQEAGRATYTHSFNSTFMEAIDYATYQDLRRWRAYMRSWKGNSGTNSQAYKINAEMDLYDNAGNPAQTVIIVGLFPTEIGQVSFNGAESTALEVPVTWSFDYLDDGISF